MVKIKFKFKLLSLREITIRFVIRNDIRYTNNFLPMELSDEIIGRKFPPLYPEDYGEFIYPDRIVNAELRVSSIGYNHVLREYVHIVSLGSPLIIRVLTDTEDKKLNEVLTDYTKRKCMPEEIRKCPYV